MQTKLQSFQEGLSNILVGLAFAIAGQLLIFPIFSIHVQLWENLGIAACFTVISLIRQYMLRRWYNHKHAPHDVLQSWRAIKCLIDDEASEVTIHNPNYDWSGPAHKVTVVGPWTSYKPFSFSGNTLLEALTTAMQEKLVTLCEEEDYDIIQ